MRGTSDAISTPDGYVLVVDDDPHVRTLHAAVLRDAAIEVAEAPDGVTALQIIRARQPSVIVTDAQMPEMDGLALARAVRADAQARDAFIVMVSSYGGLGAFIAEAKDAGCNMVFRKPCVLATLRSVVLAHLAGAR